MKVSRQDQTWNRAALEAGGANASEGDAALSALLLVHGMVMNGGIDHAIEALNADQYTIGIEGFRYFGLLEVASLLEEAKASTEADFQHLNVEYGNLVPSDNKLVHAFRLKLLASPEMFYPV